MGTGRFTPKGLEKQPLPDQPPEWVKRKSEETLEQWRNRIEADFFEYQLNQGFAHDIVALKRHELASKHLWPIKQELDIGQKQPDWMRSLTDEELLMLKAIKDRALGRQQNQLVSETITVQGNGDIPQDGGQ